MKCMGTLFERKACENLVGFFMYDSPMATVEHIWANIWCMNIWIGLLDFVAKLQECTSVAYSQ